ncbi:response regulator transcription factor [uncultured Granulicatella sp.]|uniref:response regulator transcription factor n=1 Tax=uncultured Granulicatella sp. TaxID=316089 RepID=UPI0028DC401C|nr:response regulator transcription factor [uncultured Granulicatella sp.]
MKILIAEDEWDLAEALKLMFELQKYSVEVVDNGEDAIFYAETTPYDVIILDVMMPKKNGVEVVRSLRAKGISTPVLMLTAKSQLEDKVLGLEEGADDYLTKPFEAAELLVRVKSLLRRPTQFVSSTLSLGNVQLKREQYVMETPQGQVALNNKEFQLMEYFMLHQNQILSTDFMMEKVWGFDAECEINVVWVNISSIRKKLASIQANVRIKSARGIGYQLVVEE